MGLTLSHLSSPLIIFLRKKASVLDLLESRNFRKNDEKKTPSLSFENSTSGKPDLLNEKTEAFNEANEEKDTAATRLQKFYKSYRTRRNLADCAVVVEELW